MPEGICVTWGKDLIIEKGGLLCFLRWFNDIMNDGESYWMNKCKNKPVHDVLYVYIIICNRVHYRCGYAGYETGETSGFKTSWSSRDIIGWPRIILAPPLIKAPYKIRLSGFRGFRYCTKLF